MILLFVVGGEDVPIEVDEKAPFSVAVQAALEKSRNLGRPFEDWEPRCEWGRLIDPSMPTPSHFLPRALVFLSLRAGSGGHSSADVHRLLHCGLLLLFRG